MSIFKETIAESIQTQLQARTNVIAGNSSSTINNNNRNNLLPFYLSKNSWVRMTSFVNFTSGKDLTFNGAGNIDVKPDGSYKGNQLSKKYILEGGTLYAKSNNGTNIADASLRYGIAQKNSVYGGNIDVRANNTVDRDYYQTYGIRPMPGIIDVNMHTKSAYGSLFETTIKFYAWDINQLNELELLFMRPGYSVLLEWGWSQYLDYDDDKSVKKLTSDKIKSQVFNGITINPFDNLSQQDVYDKLETLRVKYRHNYDGMLGYIKNFSWKMMSNGGYECQTTLISMGEVINSLKISVNSNNTKNIGTFNINDPSIKSYSYDEYENILLSLKFLSETKNFPYLEKIYNTDGDKVYAINEDEYRGTWRAAENAIPIEDIKAKLIAADFDKYAKYLDNQPLLQNIVNNESKENASDNGTYYEYISLDVWFAIMAAYFNFKTTNNKTTKTDYLIKIIPPKDDTFTNSDLCLAGSDTISTDPSICIVRNSKAFDTELSYLNLGSYTGPGIQPQVTDANGNPRNLPEFYDDNLKAGYIGNIFVNLSLLLGEYKSIKNNTSDDGVNFMTYVNSILKKISNAMGGLNNFGLSTIGRDQNQIKLIDLYYLERNAKPKYEFDLMGLGSICRNVSIESQIFPEQSTIIAIAAQSRANLGDVYNSTQVYLNAGLTDRIALQKWQGEEITQPDGSATDPIYQKTFDFLLYLKDYVIGDSTKKFEIETQTNGTIPYTFLKQFLLRFDGELNFKALIPFKLKITLDGIGGIVVGQIFKVKSNVLPKNYIDKNLGFVITGISHTLTKNDWETSLETQICILDDSKFYNADGKHVLSNKIVRKGFESFVGEGIKLALLYPVLIDFLEYQAFKSFLMYSVSKGVSFGETLNISSRNYTTNEQLNILYDTKWKPLLTKEHFEFNPNKDTAMGLSQDKGTTFTKNYGVDQFFGFFQKWVEREKTKRGSNILNTKITSDTTYIQALEELAKTDSSNKYFNIIVDIQQKIAQNIDIFYYYPFYRGGNVIGRKFGPTADIINYTLLRNNLEYIAGSRNIGNQLKSAYYGLLLPNKKTLAAFAPIVNDSAFDFTIAGSMMYHYKISQIDVSNKVKGAIDIVASNALYQLDIYKSWMNTFTVDLNDADRDKLLKTNFINNLYLYLK